MQDMVTTDQIMKNAENLVKNVEDARPYGADKQSIGLDIFSSVMPMMDLRSLTPEETHELAKVLGVVILGFQSAVELRPQYAGAMFKTISTPLMQSIAALIGSNLELQKELAKMRSQRCETLDN